MAALIQSLYFAGSRLSTGAPNDTGTVYAYIPGTVSPATIYADADATIAITQPITLDAGGRIPYATYPDGVWITAPVRLFVKDVDGNTVSDAPFWPADARDTMLVNDNFTGDTVDEALSEIAGSAGGTDGNYLESGGATERTIQDKFREISISVKDFGARGDNIQTDTIYIQTALNRIKALGGGTLYFPPGTYVIDQTLTLTSGTGIRIIGSAATIKSTSTSLDSLVLSGCSGCAVSDLTITPQATSTGRSLAITTGSQITVDNMVLDNAGVALDLTGANFTVRNTYMRGYDVAGRGLRSAATGLTVIGGYALAGSGAAIEFTGAAARTTVFGVDFGPNSPSTPVGILFNATTSGTLFTVSGCPSLGSQTLPIDLTGLATDPVLRQWGNNVDGYVTSQASGGGGGSTFTPDRSRGQEPHIRLTSGGAAILTVNAPTPTPSTSQRNTRITFKITAAAGGAITARFDGVYKIDGGGTDIVVADTNTQVVEFLWDVQVSKWRETNRVVTAT